MARASTTPDLTTEVAQTVDYEGGLPDNLDKAVGHEDILRTGKKMANDFRDGLWTFFEDLRQATVGDEAELAGQQVMPGHSPQIRRHNSTLSTASTASVRTARKKDSKNSLRPSSRGSTTTAAGNKERVEARRPSPNQARKHVKSATQGALPDLADPTFWTEHGITTAQTTPATVPKKSPTVRGHAKTASKAISSASSDAWDTWEDSPKDSRSSSAASDVNTLPSSVSGPTSPRSSAEKKDPIPWPALSKFGPATLKRTASHLMSEWEKSLTPSPGKEYTGQEDYLGLGAEAAATQSVSGKRE